MKLREIPTYYSVATCYIGIFSIVFILGYPSPTQKQLIDEGLLDYNSLPIFASIKNLTKTLGLLIVPILIQCNISMYIQIRIGCVIGMIGWMCILLAKSASLMILGAGLLGFYTGVFAIFTFTYVPEICLDSQVKVLSGGYGFCIRIALFVTYLIGIWLTYDWMAIVGLAMIFTFCLLLLFSPISPSWYVRHNMINRAKDTLEYLHGKDIDADSEIKKIQDKLPIQQDTILDKLKYFMDWKVNKLILVMSGLGFLKEFGGHEAMVSLSSHILENQSAMNPKVASLFYPIFLIIGAIVSLSILNCCKLKFQSMLAASLQALAHLSMAVFYLVSENTFHCQEMNHQTLSCQLLSIWPIVNVSLYSFSFAVGWGLIYYSLMGILFPTHREWSSAVTDTFANLSAYFVILTFYYLLHSIGGFWTFLLFSLEHVVTVLYVYFAINV